MLVIVTAVLFIISLYCVKRSKNIFHPLFIFICPILISVLIYTFLYSEFKLSFKTVLCFLTGIIAFYLGYGICTLIFPNKILKNEIFEIKVNKNIYCVLKIIMYIGLLVGFFYFVFNGLNGPYGMNFVRNVRWNSLYANQSSFILQLISISTVFIQLFTLIQIYNDYVKYSSITKKSYIYIFLLFASSLFTMARTGILQYILSIVYIIYIFKFKGKRTLKQILKKFIYFIILIIFVISVFTWIAISTAKLGNNFSLFDKDFYIYTYIGYGLITFEKYVVAHPGFGNGFFVLNSFSAIFSMLGLYNSLELQNVVVIPNTEHNVSTFITDPYKDFGIIGIAFIMILIGFFVGFVFHNANKKGGLWAVFYSVYIYSIFISFYAFQMTNAFYIYCLIIILSLKIKSRIQFKWRN